MSHTLSNGVELPLETDGHPRQSSFQEKLTDFRCLIFPVPFESAQHDRKMLKVNLPPIDSKDKVRQLLGTGESFRGCLSTC